MSRSGISYFSVRDMAGLYLLNEELSQTGQQHYFRILKFDLIIRNLAPIYAFLSNDSHLIVGNDLKTFNYINLFCLWRKS